jgi:hypothetical protein
MSFVVVTDSFGMHTLKRRWVKYCASCYNHPELRNMDEVCLCCGLEICKYCLGDQACCRGDDE